MRHSIFTKFALVFFVVMFMTFSSVLKAQPSDPSEDGSTTIQQEAPPTDSDSVEHVEWEGSVTLPVGGKLDILVKFRRGSADEPWTANIDIPMQNAFDLPLMEVVYSESELGFALAPHIGAVFHAVIDVDDATKASGELKQNGMEFPLVLKKVPAGEEPSVHRAVHPQTPKPPFPYEAREVSYKNDAGGITIAGTLTIPGGDGPFPAVVMITGSGAQDRDEALMGHKPFAVIADYLTRHGIAVLRSDDRGVGGTTGSVSLSTSVDFAGDALAGVSFLQGQKEIDGKRIGLVGHSEGGLIAPIAAAKSDAVDFIVLLAGTGVSGRDVLVRQLADISKAGGADDDSLKKQAKAQVRFLDLLMADEVDEAKLAEALRYLSYVQIDPEHADEPDAMNEKLKDQVEATIPAAMVQYQSPWFKAFLKFDPRTALRKVHCPVLAINGSLDTQVAPDLNLPAIREALAEAGNEHVTIKEFEGLNHLFQHCKTGSPTEYAMIDETISPEVLDYVTNWIRKTVGE